MMTGVGTVPYRTFLIYDLIGGGLWSVGLVFGGFYLGRLIPEVDRYLLPTVMGVVVLSFLPGIYHLLKDEHQR
jgi:membrane-associated protein